jgi:tetratricopeptide (TPR) repeat protein
LLVSGEARKPDTLDLLLRVVENDPSNIEARNDLAVCYLENGRLVDALDELNALIERAPEFAEAVHNRAICYERLLLYEPAIADFERLRPIEPDRAWRDEALERQRKLEMTPKTPKSEEVTASLERAKAANDENEIVTVAAANFEMLRRLALIEWPLEYLKAVSAGAADLAAPVASRLELVGRLFTRIAADRQAADMGAYLSALDHTEAATQATLLEAYLESLETYNRGEYRNTELSLRELIPRIKATGNWLHQRLAESTLGLCLFALMRTNESIEVLSDVLQEAEARGWRSFGASMQIQIAAAHARLGRDSLALKGLESARLECCDFPDFNAKLAQFQYAPYVHLGDLDEAMRVLMESVRIFLTTPARAFPKANIAYNYNRLADLWSLRERHDLAILYGRAALSYAQQSQYNVYIADFSAFLAVEYARIGDFGSAQQNLNLGLEALDRLSEKDFDHSTAADVYRLAGEVAFHNGDSNLALERFAAAEHHARLGGSNPSTLISAIQSRARAFAGAGQLDRAWASIREATDIIETYPDNFESSDQRHSFLGASQRAFDQAIEFAALQNLWPEAFSISERSRARALLGQLSFSGGSTSPGAATPLDLPRVQASLPDNVVLLSYSVGRDYVYAFVVGKSGLTTAQSAIKSDELDRLVASYVGLIKTEDAPLDLLDRAGAELYQLLVRPVESYLPPGSTVCIVPDKSLHFLPFAALRGSDGYFVERHPLCYAPSASVFAQCLRTNRQRSAAPERTALVVGDPQFDPGLNLRRLPDAEMEAIDVAKLFGTTPLIGAEATEPRVCQGMRDAEIVHVASHTVVNDNSP